MSLILSGTSLEKILEEQYYLSSKANISISDSNNMADFEREIYVGLLTKDLKNKKGLLDGL
jgi:hypothetical protein